MKPGAGPGNHQMAAADLNTHSMAPRAGPGLQDRAAVPVTRTKYAASNLSPATLFIAVQNAVRVSGQNRDLPRFCYFRAGPRPGPPAPGLASLSGECTGTALARHRPGSESPAVTGPPDRRRLSQIKFNLNLKLKPRLPGQDTRRAGDGVGDSMRWRGRLSDLRLLSQARCPCACRTGTGTFRTLTSRAESVRVRRLEPGPGRAH